MIVISMIGFSGSGKTEFIVNAIKLLQDKLNLTSVVIKNIHKHQIDEEGKDSYKFTHSGAIFSITKNVNNETTIFLKKEISIEHLIDWLLKSPFGVDIVFTEGFRDLNYPTILCIKDYGEIESQKTNNVRMISGLILKEKTHEAIHLGIPIIHIQDDFFKISENFQYW